MKQDKNNNKKTLLETYMKYFELSKYLFGQGENGIFDINEIPPDNKFHTPAKEMAKSLGVNWNAMTHSESNRIMLALLEDTYMSMKQIENSDKVMVEIKLKFLK